MGNGFSMLVLLEWDRLVLQMGGEQVVDKNLRRGRSCLNRVKSKKQKRELIYWGGGLIIVQPKLDTADELGLVGAGEEH